MLPNVHMYSEDGVTTIGDKMSIKDKLSMIKKSENDIFSKRSKSVMSRHSKVDSKM